MPFDKRDMAPDSSCIRAVRGPWRIAGTPGQRRDRWRIVAPAFMSHPTGSSPNPRIGRNVEWCNAQQALAALGDWMLIMRHGMESMQLAPLIRSLIHRLLAGQPPQDDRPLDAYGPWRDVVTALTEAYARGGAAQVQTTLHALTRFHRGLARLFPEISVASTTAVAQMIGAAPPLPAAAEEVYHALPATTCWIDDYVAFARQHVPTTPDNFHEAAAIWMISLAIARRLVLRHAAGDFYPNLYMLYIADSGYGKSTALRLMRRTIEAAGLRHLLLINQMTPESFFNGLSMRIPPTFDAWDDLARERWMQERAFAAQRGWLIDEASFFFDSLSREYMTGLLGYVLDFYDCPDEESRETQSGGRVTVRHVYPTFFGVTTPASMSAHLRNERFWNDGLWARFVLLSPPNPPQWTEVDEAVAFAASIPSSISDGLRWVYERFPLPAITITDTEDGRRSVTVDTPITPSSVHLAPGVFHAWQCYRKAISFDLGLSDAVDELLRSPYQRLPTMAMKVAMIMAVIDSETNPAGPVTITLGHFARAQALVERWRSNLHHFWARETKHDEQVLADRLLNKLRQPGPSGDGWTVRELQLYTKQPKRKIEEVLHMLAEAGLVGAVQGRSVRWTAIPDLDEARGGFGV